jgi:hypothetical protein
VALKVIYGKRIQTYLDALLAVHFSMSLGLS